MKITVTGATGFIGRSLCTELLHRGHSVTAFTRDPNRSINQLPKGVIPVSWENKTSSEWKAICADSEVIINLAGESVGGQRWTPEYKAKLMDSRVQTTRNLIDTFSKNHHPQKLISASAVGFYGDRGEEELTEKSIPGADFLAILSQAWEKEADTAVEADVSIVKLRIGIVLGNGGALKQMIYPLPIPISPWKLGVGGPLGSGKQWMPWIHLKDLVSMIAWAAEMPSVSGVYNAVSPNPVRNSEFSHAIGRILHRPSFLPIPAFVLKAMLGEFSGVLLGGQKALPQAAIDAGYKFEFNDIDNALRDLVNSGLLVR